MSLLELIPAQSLNPDGVVIWTDFIDREEQARLTGWALQMRPYLKPNGPGRAVRRIERLPHVPPLHTAVRERLQQRLGMAPNAQPEPTFGWYLSIISDGGAVHPHIDPTQTGKRHLRCNLFLQLPTTGGRPVVERRIQNVSERALLTFFPSERRHCSEPVAGARDRIILSFGYLVDESFKIG